MINNLSAPCFVFSPPRYEDGGDPHYTSLESGARALHSHIEDIRSDEDPEAVARAEQIVLIQESRPCGVLVCDGCDDEYEDDETGGSHLLDAEDEDDAVKAAVEDGWTRGPDATIHCRSCPALAPPGPAEYDVPLPGLAPPMPQEELVRRIRAGLTDEAAWQCVVATPELAKRTRDWLVLTKMEVDQDLATKRAALTKTLVDIAPGTPARKAVEHRYRDWRHHALNFRRLVERRFSEVAATVARQDAERRTANREVHGELDRTRSTLMTLVGAVEAAVAGQLTLDELSTELDRLTLPHGLDETRTLRQVLALRVEKELQAAG